MKVIPEFAVFAPTKMGSLLFKTLDYLTAAEWDAMGFNVRIAEVVVVER